MATFIEEYRGWEISFDTDNETFIVYSSYYDEEQQEKKSFTACKKYIDDFIKANEKFKPVTIYRPPSAFNGFKKVVLTGIRKDKALTYEENGAKKKLSKYDERDYVIYEPWMDEVHSQVENMEADIDKLRRLKDQYIKDNLYVKAVQLAAYKKKHFPD